MNRPSKSLSAFALLLVASAVAVVLAEPEAVNGPGGPATASADGTLAVTNAKSPITMKGLAVGGLPTREEGDEPMTMTDDLGRVEYWMGIDLLTRFFPHTLSFAYYSFERLTTVFQMLRFLAFLSLLHAICRVFPWGRAELGKRLIDGAILVYIGIALPLLAVISCDVFVRMSLGAQSQENRA